MGDEIVEFNLPPAPRGLCFDRLDFVKTNFSVDNFLFEHQNVTSLETIRDDLGVYLKVLRLAMIDLINKDYANFVNLSATLIGFDKSIEKIKSPLVQLNEEMLNVKQCLEDAMKEMSMWLNQRHLLQKKKLLLKYYCQTIKCLRTLDKILSNISDKSKQEKIILVDRGTLQYNQLKFCIAKCEASLKPEQRTQYNIIGEMLIQTLNELLFQFWNDNDEENLIKTLAALASLDKVTETEATIRKQAVTPLIQEIITKYSQQKNKQHFKEMYDDIIILLDTKLKLYRVAMQHSKLAFLVKKYNFVINCFWKDVESQLEINMAIMFAAGDPNLFHYRYYESRDFLIKLEGYCGNTEMVKLLHDTTEYKSYQRRWNLPVYFQIRFQDIAGTFESSLQTTPSPSNSARGFRLIETESCWKALQDCWSEGVFIQALGHKFWKLSLQIIQRYTTWTAAVCQEKTSQTITDPGINKDQIRSSINVYIDSRTLLQKLPDFLKMVETKLSIDNTELLRKSMGPCIDGVFNIRRTVLKSINCILYDTVNWYLRQVSDIPRLYRKTNRSVPTKACTYIELVSKTIQDVTAECFTTVDKEFLNELFVDLFNTTTNVYNKYVEDVITSVQKTEESLRRLKQIRENMSQPMNEVAGVTDGDKIRLQLNIDVKAYQQLALAIHVDVTKIPKFKELHVMVTEAVKNIDIK